MSCSTLNNSTALALNVSIANLPEGFCPASWQEAATVFAARLLISPSDNFNTFSIGSTAPTANVGPWLKDCLTWYVYDDETASYVPMVLDNTNSVISGVVMAWAGLITAIPTGYLFCDGTEYNNTDFPNLFAAIGTQYGSSAGTTFKVPDLRDAFLAGASVDSGGTSKTTVTDGATLTKSRVFTAHTHTVSVSSIQSQGGNGSFSSLVSSPTGVDSPRAIPPFLSMAYMIKT